MMIEIHFKYLIISQKYFRICDLSVEDPDPTSSSGEAEQSPRSLHELQLLAGRARESGRVWVPGGVLP